MKPAVLTNRDKSASSIVGGELSGFLCLVYRHRILESWMGFRIIHTNPAYALTNTQRVFLCFFFPGEYPEFTVIKRFFLQVKTINVSSDFFNVSPCF